ncbi:SWIM zinc finger family protein [Bradyrhizobium sp. 83012]|uniref:SWIM zinc finger family protein n=1 Tax=Bradyrhizobium aeschynomenes TaxID=2734909 RepID=A0ABX2CEA6_9BRAD|nr:SWIM zinc finger family protein [Bradyrhizobium aeschynomenes]
MSLTRERIEGLAPDQASLAAALKLVKPASWPVLAASTDAEVLWGECQGSGATPYRIVTAADGGSYKCTCPSRKFPCKHVLAVLWLRVDKPERFESASPPQWVEDWSARRRGGGHSPGKPKPDGDEAGTPPSLDAALAEAATTTPADPKAAARAEAQRERIKAEREGAILAGLDELERWIADQLNQGLADFAGRVGSAARTLSTRLVDAKAGGLAARLDQLGTELFRVGEERRADLAIERLGAMALIASAYRHQDRLPAPLRDDVRRAVGWSLRREELLADATAPRVTSVWIVAANLSEVQPDKLRRLETWMINASTDINQPRAAVLIDFVPVSGGGAGFPFSPGELIEGEVVFYPSAAPLRGLLASRKTAITARWPQSLPGLTPALQDYAGRLAALPWLDRWPLLLSNVALRTAGKNALGIADVSGAAIAVERSQFDQLLPLLGLDDVSLLCLWDGRTAQVLAADTPLGRWHHED